MIVSLVLGFVLAQAPNVGLEPTRLRTALPNGATILVEPSQTDRNVNIMLFAASRGIKEPKSGLRHLLEHLCVEGKDGHLDDRLESAGAFLKAQTTRDFMEVSIACDPSNYQVGIAALKEIIAPQKWSADRLKHEVEVIDQEAALEDESSKLAAGAWGIAFKEAGADPVGDMAALKTATPEELDAVRAQTFDPSRLVIVIEGPIKLGEGTDDARSVLSALKMRDVAIVGDRVPAATHGRVEISGFGEARGLIVPAMSDPQAAAGLSAALAIASLVPDSFVTYTPSTEAAVITVGNTTKRNVVGRTIDDLDAGRQAGLFVRGRALAYRWFQNHTREPAVDAEFRGELLVQNPTLKPDKLLANIVAMTSAQFQAAMAKLGHDTALVAVGVGQ